jgi:hypothetical protein
MDVIKDFDLYAFVDRHETGVPGKSSQAGKRRPFSSETKPVRK